MSLGAIRAGTGGWVYDPWRETFYPDGLAKAKQLEYLATHLTAAEVNATFYSRQAPATFAKWRKTAPPHFRFALKGSRYCTNRKNLAEAGESVANFIDQGLVELEDRLGPINWQLNDKKRFDPEEIAAFLALLPSSHAGVPLRHAIEARHESFDDPAFYALLQDAGAALVVTRSEDYPDFTRTDGPFVYARRQGCRADEPTGYSAKEIAAQAAEAVKWAADGRETFVFYIAGAKERAPAAALALIEALGEDAVRPASC